MSERQAEEGKRWAPPGHEATMQAGARQKLSVFFLEVQKAQRIFTEKTLVWGRQTSGPVEVLRYMLSYVMTK